MSGDLQAFKDALSRAATGLTVVEARAKGICAQCRNPPEFYSEGGRREYPISGLCEFCFDMACDPELCRDCGTPSSWHKHGKTPCKEFNPPPDGASTDA